METLQLPRQRVDRPSDESAHGASDRVTRRASAWPGACRRATQNASTVQSIVADLQADPTTVYASALVGHAM